jgi:hypothetical protein
MGSNDLMTLSPLCSSSEQLLVMFSICRSVPSLFLAYSSVFLRLPSSDCHSRTMH